MNINWYSFYYKIGTISATLLILGLFTLAPFLIDDPERVEMFDTSWYMPYLVITFIATVFSWLMAFKYRSLRNIPEVATEKETKLYSIIGISLVLLFLLLLLALPIIMQ